jgi:hypothetical protein
MYAAARRAPSCPTRRPSIESCANAVSRRSSAARSMPDGADAERAPAVPASGALVRPAQPAIAVRRTSEGSAERTRGPRWAGWRGGGRVVHAWRAGQMMRIRASTANVTGHRRAHGAGRRPAIACARRHSEGEPHPPRWGRRRSAPRPRAGPHPAPFRPMRPPTRTALRDPPARRGGPHRGRARVPPRTRAARPRSSAGRSPRRRSWSAWTRCSPTACERGEPHVRSTAARRAAAGRARRRLRARHALSRPHDRGRAMRGRAVCGQRGGACVRRAAPSPAARHCRPAAPRSRARPPRSP